MTIAAPQLFVILDEEFELDQLNDIITHGMSAGVSGFIYSSEIRDKWDEHEDVITDYLDGFCEDNFGQSMWSYIAEQLSFDDKYWTKQELIEHAVWMYVELRAHDLYNAANGDY